VRIQVGTGRQIVVFMRSSLPWAELLSQSAVPLARRSSAPRGLLPSVVPPNSVPTLPRHGEVRQDRTVTRYLGGPPWPELDAALARRDLPGALALAEQSAEVDPGERQLVIGICRSVFHQADLAAEALLQSFHTFAQEHSIRAAVSAVFLGRMYYFMHDNPHVANGWFARARTLVAGQPDGIEHILVALPLPGCDIDNVTALRADAERSLGLARHLGERNLEAKALSDLGTALASLAEVEEAMTRLDEAMTMVVSGEADSPFVSGDVVCNLLTACGRAGDLDRGRLDPGRRGATGLRHRPRAAIHLRALPLSAGPDPV
jgi:hypothetical protein